MLFSMVLHWPDTLLNTSSTRNVDYIYHEKKVLIASSWIITLKLILVNRIINKLLGLWIN